MSRDTELHNSMVKVCCVCVCARKRGSRVGGAVRHKAGEMGRRYLGAILGKVE